jgi:hypothetical protein
VVGVTVVCTLAGAAMVLVALRDVFNTLVHQHGHGVLSEALIRIVWRATRAASRGRHEVLSLAGPLAFLGVIAAWGALVIVGFALIIWPHLPDGFEGVGVDPDSGFLDALYLSMVNLTSLGYGDIVPRGELLRLAGPLETLIGLGLLTASISWILLLYRVLGDYRSLSHEIALSADAERLSGVSLAEVEPAVSARVLADLSSRVIAMRDDLVHSPIAYYFHPSDPRHALPVLLPRLIGLLDECSGPGHAPALRFQAAMLRQSLEDLLRTIAERFAGGPAEGWEDALAAYRRDHLWMDGGR